jgi:ubiquinone/menaquinone biosynthesis C-methylase UbiE
MMSQETIFSQSEADKWFLRNHAALANSERVVHDPVLKLLDTVGLKPRHVLEIGASNGYRLHQLQQKYQANAWAVEPSLVAIQDGQQRYPAIKFLQGVANALPITEDGKFDLVIMNFVFHWIDRVNLFSSIAEIDRMLADGGSLIIGDFYPAFPERVVYHHLPNANVWTYKQNYLDIFLASNLYELITFLVFEHDSHQISHMVSPNNRTQVVLLNKTLTERYQTKQIP